MRKSKAPVKAASFGWTVTWEASYAHSNNLQQRSSALSSRCYMCEKEKYITSVFVLPSFQRIMEVVFNVSGAS